MSKSPTPPFVCLSAPLQTTRLGPQAAAGDGPEDREAVEADVTKRPGQGEGHGGSARHGGHADQRAEEGKEEPITDGGVASPPPPGPLLTPVLWFHQEFHRLQDENFQLKTICEDQERALEELGSKLSEYVCLRKEKKTSWIKRSESLT